MMIDSSGNVGIGTSSPGSKLEISSSSDNLLELNGGATSNPYMLFAQNGTRRAFIQYVNGGLLSLVSEYGDVRFMTGTGGVETEKMRIKSNGNVGIGTTSPSAKLEVVGGASHGTGITQARSGHPSFSLLNGGTNSVYLGIAPDGGSYNTFMQIVEDGTDINYLRFNTGAATERMRITSTGAISFGSAGTAYGTSGQVLTSNGNASPTWQDAAGESYTPLAVTKNGSNQFPVVFANAENFSLSCAGTWSITATIASGDVGKTGTIIITNTATTTPGSLPSTFKTPNGDTVVFQTDNGDVSILSYLVVSTSIVLVNYVGNFS